MHHILGFTEYYLVPFCIALGLILFFRGVVNYFFIGASFEEDRREMGRHDLLWSAAMIIIGLLIYWIIFGVADFFGSFSDRAEVDVEDREGLLQIPNVPLVR